jgi:O-antigen/teichoic acid export membrane protein
VVSQLPPEGDKREAPRPTRRDSTGQKVTGAMSWTLFPRVIQVVASLGTSVLIVRTLGEFDYGTLSVLRSLLIFAVVVLGLGLGQAINRFIPELRVTDRRHEGRGLLYRCLLLQSALWVISCLVLLLLRGVLQAQYPTYGHLVVLGVFLSLAEVAAGTVTQYAIASYRTREMALATSLGTLVLAGGTALLLHLGLRVPGVLVASAAGFAATTLTLVLLLRHSSAGAAEPRGPAVAAAPWSWPRPANDLKLATGALAVPWKRFLGYALPWVPNFLLLFVVWRQSETILLGIYRSRQDAGFFDLAYKLPMLVLEFIPSAVYPLVLAGFAETATIARERMTEVIETYYRLLFFIVTPLALLGFAMGDTLLARLYGENMAQAGAYCQVFFLVFAIGFLGTPLSMTVYIFEKVWVNVLLNVAYGVVVLGLDLLLIPRYGLLGATIPTSLVTVITPFVRYVIARKYLDDIRIPWAFIARAALASSPLLALAWAKRWATDLPRTALVLLVAAAVTLLCYRWARVLRPEDRELLRRSRIPARHWILRII